jgi:SNF2 family DNA or RNA helicase
MAAQLVNAHDRAAVVWCNLNEEGNRLAKAINGAVEVSGNDSEEHKEETFAAFIRGDVRVLVTKPTIGGFGLNLQHCAHQTYFPSHSYEQYYQSVRRCWRFGQKNPVVVDMVTTDGQEGVLLNLQRKTEQASAMFDHLVAMMWNEMKIEKRNDYTKKEEAPSWL